MFKRSTSLPLYCLVFLWLLFGVSYYSGLLYWGELLFYLMSVFVGYFLSIKIFPKVRIRLNFPLIQRYLPYSVLVITPILIIGHYISIGYFPLSKTFTNLSALDYALIRQSITANVAPIWNYTASLLARAILPFFLVYFYVYKDKRKLIIWGVLSSVYCLSLLQKSYIVVLFLPIIILLLYRRDYWYACIAVLIPIFGVTILFIGSTGGVAKYWSAISHSAIFSSISEAATKHEINDKQQIKVSTPFEIHNIYLSDREAYRTLQSSGTNFVVIQYDFGEPMAVKAVGVKSLLFSGSRSTAYIEYSTDGVNFQPYGEVLKVSEFARTFTIWEQANARFIRLRMHEFAWNGYAQFSDFAIIHSTGTANFAQQKYNNNLDWIYSAPNLEWLKFCDNVIDITRDKFAHILKLPLMERILISPGHGVTIWFQTFPEQIPFAYGSGYRLFAKVKGIPYVNLDRVVYDQQHPDMAAQGLQGTENTASFMTEYANFGYWGLALSGLLLGFILHWIELIFAYDQVFLLTFNFYPLFILSSTTLFSTIVSGGWGLTIILYLLLLEPTDNARNFS